MDSRYNPTNSNDRSLEQYVQQTTSHDIHTQDIVTEEIHKEYVHQSTETNHSDANHMISSNKRVKQLKTDIYNIQIDKLSLDNRNLCDQLQSVRNQLSDNLNRVRDFEERVKLIPKLQLQLSVEKAENRDLHLKLKALENTVEKQHENKTLTEQSNTKVNSSTNTEMTISALGGPFNPHRVCATSLESLNIRFSPNSSSSYEPPKSYTSPMVPIQTSTQNVGCMTTTIFSRDVGIVTVPVQISTRNMAINTDISEKNPFEGTQTKPVMKSVGVQGDYENNVEKRTVATITDPQLSSPSIKKCSVSIMAVPNVQTIFCMAKPEVRSVGVDNIFQKRRLRSFGTDPIKHLVEQVPFAKFPDSPISLKLLDVPLASICEKDSKFIEAFKEFRSIGIQESPSVSSKLSQCKKYFKNNIQLKSMRMQNWCRSYRLFVNYLFNYFKLVIFVVNNLLNNNKHY